MQPAKSQPSCHPCVRCFPEVSCVCVVAHLLLLRLPAHDLLPEHMTPQIDAENDRSGQQHSPGISQTDCRLGSVVSFRVRLLLRKTSNIYNDYNPIPTTSSTRGSHTLTKDHQAIIQKEKDQQIKSLANDSWLQYCSPALRSGAVGTGRPWPIQAAAKRLLAPPVKQRRPLPLLLLLLLLLLCAVLTGHRSATLSLGRSMGSIAAIYT